jgi:hypothetical protein
MIRRFQERDKLVEALRRQQIVQNDKTVAEKLAEVAEFIQFASAAPSNALLSQNAPDNDLFPVLAGKVSVWVNGRELALRQASQHVGEMAMIDSSASRCATVIAIEQTVVAESSSSHGAWISSCRPTGVALPYLTVTLVALSKTCPRVSAPPGTASARRSTDLRPGEVCTEVFRGADAGTQDLETDVDAVFQTQWLKRDGRKVPEPEDVRR